MSTAATARSGPLVTDVRLVRRPDGDVPARTGKPALLCFTATGRVIATGEKVYHDRLMFSELLVNDIGEARVIEMATISLSGFVRRERARGDPRAG